MNIEQIHKLDKLNYYVALLLMFGSFVYAAITAEHVVVYDDYTYAPVMISILVILSTYVFFTLVKSNGPTEFVIGISSIVLLWSITPIIGSMYDPMGTTAQYYSNVVDIISCGIVYIITFKIFKYVWVSKHKDGGD